MQVLIPVQEFFDSTLAQYLALVENHNAVGNRFNLFHVVRGINHGAALSGKLFDRIEQKCPRLWIDSGRWFVEKNQFGSMKQGNRQIEPSFQSTGKTFCPHATVALQLRIGDALRDA